MARNTNLNVAPGGGGGAGGGAPRAVRTVKISPNVTIKAPKGGPGFTPKEVTRLKSITEVTKPTSKATAKVNAKALKASGVVKPKTDTKTTNYNMNDWTSTNSTARADAREAVASRAAAAKKAADAAAAKERLRIGDYRRP